MNPLHVFLNRGNEQTQTNGQVPKDRLFLLGHMPLRILKGVFSMVVGHLTSPSQ